MDTELGRTSSLQTQLTFELTRAVAQARELEDVYEAALTCLGASLGTHRCAILLFGDESKMRFRAWRNLSETYRTAVDGHSPWTREDSNPEPVLVADVSSEPTLAGLRQTIEDEGIRSLAFFPLVADGRLLGKFMVYFDTPHEFNELDVMVAQTIAAQVAFALDQDATRESNQRLDALNQIVIESFGVAVYTTNADGVITRYNDAAAELWGRRPEIGRDLWCGSWRLFWPDGTAMAHEDCPMGMALREDRLVRGKEILVENPDGSRHVVLPYPTPLHDRRGKLIGAVNVLVDITSQAEMRSELERHLVAKDDFLGQVSHELRTPLHQVVGNAHLLVKRWADLDEATKLESLGEIQSQAERMQRLVTNMLVLSRLERGIPPETEPVLIQRLVSSTMDEFKRRFPRVQLVLEIPGDLPPVESNESTLDQVLWNLLTNAEKYGPKEGPITVSACAGEGTVEVRVQDVGQGVPAAELNSVFKPYFRSSENSSVAPGLGLGLSVCQTLVEAQRGAIWARRRETRGMEFGFSVPALSES